MLQKTKENIEKLVQEITRKKVNEMIHYLFIKKIQDCLSTDVNIICVHGKNTQIDASVKNNSWSIG